MTHQIKKLAGITLCERIFNEGSINTSVSYASFNLGKKTPGIAIKYVSSGFENYIINEKTKQLFQGQFLILRNDVYFDVSHTSKNNITKGACINLDVYGQNDYSDLINNDLLFNIKLNANFSTEIGRQLSKISLDKISSKAHNAKDLFDINSSLLILSEELNNIKIRLSPHIKKTSTQTRIVQQLFTTREFIYHIFFKKTSLDQLAKISMMSKFHLQRLFKTCFNISPLEMINRLRMEKAKQLISTNKHTLSFIAQELGYTDLSSFSVQFKKHYKIPPSKYIYSL